MRVREEVRCRMAMEEEEEGGRSVSGGPKASLHRGRAVSQCRPLITEDSSVLNQGTGDGRSCQGLAL